jgi:hypothetical protein
VLAVCLGCEVSGISRERSAATIENDLAAPVRVRLCDSDDCRGGFHPQDHVLQAGERYTANVSSVGVPSVYLVTSPDGRHRFGCLPLVSPELRRTEPFITVFVSEHVKCRDGLDEDKFWPARWATVK